MADQFGIGCAGYDSFMFHSGFTNLKAMSLNCPTCLQDQPCQHSSHKNDIFYIKTALKPNYKVFNIEYFIEQLLVEKNYTIWN